MKLPELSRRFSAESDAVSDEATLRFRSTSIVAPARPKKPEKTQWVDDAGDGDDDDEEGEEEEEEGGQWNERGIPKLDDLVGWCI